MALQVDQLCGGVGAERAAVRLLAVVSLHVPLYVVGVTRGETAQRTRVQLLLAILRSCSLSVCPFEHSLCSDVDAPVPYAGSVSFRVTQARVLILIKELIAAPAGDIERECRLWSRTLSLVLGSAEVVGVALHAEVAEGRAFFVPQLETRQTDISWMGSEQNNKLDKLVCAVKLCS